MSHSDHNTCIQAVTYIEASKRIGLRASQLGVTTGAHPSTGEPTGMFVVRSIYGVESIMVSCGPWCGTELGYKQAMVRMILQWQTLTLEEREEIYRHGISGGRLQRFITAVTTAGIELSAEQRHMAPVAEA